MILTQIEKRGKGILLTARNEDGDLIKVKFLRGFWEVEGLLESLPTDTRQDVEEGWQCECEINEAYFGD